MSDIVEYYRRRAGEYEEIYDFALSLILNPLKCASTP